MVTLIENKLDNGWTLFTLANKTIDVTFINYGCIITAIHVPNKEGIKENVVLAYESIEQYKDNPFYLGAVIGRVAGRIKDAEFKLGNNVCKVNKNEGNNHLHGGSAGLHNQLWDYRIEKNTELIRVIFSTRSNHGDNGYPGNVFFTVTYSLTNDGIFRIDYEAVTDKETPITLTNHSYFNLTGNLKKSIHHHFVTAPVNHYLHVNDDLIAEKLIDITDYSIFNFRKEKSLERGLLATDEQLRIVGGGYDHYFLFQQNKQRQIEVHEEVSGRKLLIKTDEPGFVMYTSNAIYEPIALESGSASKHMAVCFETQKAAAGLWLGDLPDLFITPEKHYKQYTSFQFFVDE